MFDHSGDFFSRTELWLIKAALFVLLLDHLCSHVFWPVFEKVRQFVGV